MDQPLCGEIVQKGLHPTTLILEWADLEDAM